MEKPADNRVIVPEELQEETPAVVSRRRLLKTVAATGGIVSAWAFLPEKWTRPVVEAGELSVHAEASPALRISSLEIFLGNGAVGAGNSMETGQFDFEDYYAGVDDTATLRAWITSNGTSSFSSDPSAGVMGDVPVPAEITSVNGAGETTGQVYFEFSVNSTAAAAVCKTDDTPDFCVELKAKGRVSNVECTLY